LKVFQTPDIITECLNFITNNQNLLGLSTSREAVSNLINGVLESLRVEHGIEKRFRFSGTDFDQLNDFTYLASKDRGEFSDGGSPVVVSMFSRTNGESEPSWSDMLVAANTQTKSPNYANVKVDLDSLTAKTDVTF